MLNFALMRSAFCRGVLYVRPYIKPSGSGDENGTYASTDCTGRVGETIKKKGGVSQACLGKSSSFIFDTHNMVN